MDPFLNIQIFCYKKVNPLFFTLTIHCDIVHIVETIRFPQYQFNVMMSQCIAVLFRSVVKQVDLVTLC